MRRSLPLVASLALAGCVTRPLQVSRGEVFAHVPELRASGKARVELEAGGTTTLRFDQQVEAERETSALWGLVRGTETARLTVAELIEDCPDVAPFREDTFRREPPCRLLEIDRVVAGHRRSADWPMIRGITAAMLGSTGLMVLGGTGYCAIACEEELGWDRGIAYVGAGVALVGLAVLVAPSR